MGGNWTIHGEKSKTSDGISISRMAAGPCIYDDSTKHLNNLNKTLQGRKKIATQYYDSIRAFKLKLTVGDKAGKW